jgi:hypothetical protein
LHERVTVGTPGHQAIFEGCLGVKFPHQEEAYHEEQQSDGDASEARCLAIGGFIFCLDDEGAFLLHGE